MTGHLAERLDAFVDGELDTVDRREAERHLGSCAICAQRVASRRALSRALKESLPRFRAPESVRAAAVAAATAPAPVLGAAASETWRARTPIARAFWPQLAAAVLLVGLAGLGGYGIGHQRADDAGTRDAIVASHVHSLLATHLTDVTSTDRHTVKPWFNGVLDFAPTVVDLAAQGFPLIGGRLDYIAGRRVPALVYVRNRHVINVFQWPTTRSDAPISSATDQGYDIVHWVSHHTEFWLISDLNDAELRQCATLLDAESTR
jgi:anti-sigma factor RsiW